MNMIYSSVRSSLADVAQLVRAPACHAGGYGFKSRRSRNIKTACIKTQAVFILRCILISMNIHPLFVHFPIALLSIYGFFEVIRIKAWQNTTWIRPLKTVLIVVGVTFAYISLSTGEVAEHALKDRSLRDLVEKHSFFADVTTYLFLFPAISYLFEGILTTSFANKIPEVIKKIMIWYNIKIMATPLKIILAILGVIAVFITGALGGAIVYGPDTDPFVSFIYNVLL